jgi:hypothetical protein
LVLLLGVASAQSPIFYDYGTENCTDKYADMKTYCEAYCDYHTEEYCEAIDVQKAVDTPRGTIDSCKCRCGVDQEEITYTNIQCGEDLQRKWSPSGEETSTSSCCLPAFMLLGVLSALVLRR